MLIFIIYTFSYIYIHLNEITNCNCRKISSRDRESPLERAKEVSKSEKRESMVRRSREFVRIISKHGIIIEKVGGGSPCNSLVNFGSARNAHAERREAGRADAASRGDFNETIVAHRAKFDSYALHGSYVVAESVVVACRGRPCTQFVSSSDNYAIMPTFLPLLAPTSLACTAVIRSTRGE